MYNSYFINIPQLIFIGEHLYYFHFGAVTKNASMNILVNSLWYTYVRVSVGIYLEVEILGQRVWCI